MLHQDASTHAWLPGDGGKQDLVVTMEDATGALYSAFLVEEKGTASSLRGVREVVAQHGCSARSTPIVAATTSRRPRLAGGFEDGADAGWTCPNVTRHRAHR